MLVLQRRKGERIVLDGGVEITILEITRRGVRLAVNAPPGVAVLRGETHDAIAASNAQASCMDKEAIEAESHASSEDA